MLCISSRGSTCMCRHGCFTHTIDGCQLDIPAVLSCLESTLAQFSKGTSLGGDTKPVASLSCVSIIVQAVTAAQSRLTIRAFWYDCPPAFTFLSFSLFKIRCFTDQHQQSHVSSLICNAACLDAGTVQARLQHQDCVVTWFSAWPCNPPHGLP